MKIIKKLMLICLVLAVVCALFACDTDKTGTNDTTDGGEKTTITTTADPNPDPDPNPNPNPDPNPNPENPNPGDPDEKINVTVVLRGEGVPDAPIPFEAAKGCTLREFVEGPFTSGGSKFEEVAMFYDIFVNEEAASPDVVLMDGDKITLTPKGNSDPEPDPESITVSFLTYHDGTLGASVVEYAPQGSTLKKFFERVVTDGSISFESTLQYTTWFVNGEAADANTVLKDGDEVEAYVTIGDIPNPDNPNQPPYQY